MINPYGGLSMIDNSVEFEYAIRKDFGVGAFFWLYDVKSWTK